MKIKVNNLYSDESWMFKGDSIKVEGEIDSIFHSVFSREQPKSLQEKLKLINRCQALEVCVLDNNEDLNNE